MNQNDKFNNVLNECMDRILRGDTVEDCLQAHPELARELEPLLRTALAARMASATIQPRPEFKARARSEFQVALREMEARKARRKFSFGFNWRPQLRLQTGWAIGVVASLVIVLGGSGTVAAASYSMPDSSLYSVKLATEKVLLAVAPSEVGKAELNAKFADRRTAEIEYMVAQGDAQEVQNVASLMTTNLVNMTTITGNGNDTNAGTQGGSPNLAFGSSTDGGNNQPGVLNVASAPVAASPAAPMAAPPAATRNPDATAEPASAGAVMETKSVPAPVAAVPNPSPAQDASKATSQENNTREETNSNKLSPSDREKIKKIIEDNYKSRKARLESLLEKASPKFRPAIRQAIAKSEAEYAKAIRNLEISAVLDK